MHLGRSVTAVAFWLATLLPLLYVPVVVIGLDTLNRFVLFLALILLHIGALVVGHDYSGTRPPPTARD